MAKLDEKVIARIQKLAAKGVAVAKIAENVGVSKTAARKYAEAQTPAVQSAANTSAGEDEQKQEPPKEVEHSPVVELPQEKKTPQVEKAARDFAVLFGARVTQNDIKEAAARLEPGKVRKHAVEVGGKIFPVCQIVGAASQIPSEKKKFFTSADASRVLTQLRFTVISAPAK